MENDNNEAKKTAQKVGGLLFVGCMFLGMAVGWYFDRVTSGMYAGMGIGFMLMAVTMKVEDKKIAQRVGGLLFVACMFLGMAVGQIFQNMVVGMFIGMGIGFIMMAVTLDRKSVV